MPKSLKRKKRLANFLYQRLVRMTTWRSLMIAFKYAASIASSHWCGTLY
jgi:hypothetical protein